MIVTLWNFKSWVQFYTILPIACIVLMTRVGFVTLSILLQGLLLIKIMSDVIRNIFRRKIVTTGPSAVQR